jgi:NAD(P)-dependent dehydrogenase (short-subunit alcohol dehydrogenase family)
VENEMRGIDGKVAIVTGGAGGIGSATALRLSEEGARVAVVDRHGQAARDLAARLPGEAIGIEADVASEDDVSRYTSETRERFGAVDLVHLNAGIGGSFSPMTELALTEWNQVIAVNLTGVFLGCRSALRVMRDQGTGGAIVTSSVGGLVGAAFLAHYHAAKHGVIGIMKCAAMEGAADGVRANAIAPGMVLTDLARVTEEHAGGGDAPRNAQVELIPLGRPGVPDDIASVVCHLLSSDAGYVTGVVVPVEGGSLADHPRARAIVNLARRRST